MVTLLPVVIDIFCCARIRNMKRCATPLTNLAVKVKLFPPTGNVMRSGAAVEVGEGTDWVGVGETGTKVGAITAVAVGVPVFWTVGAPRNPAVGFGVEVVSMPTSSVPQAVKEEAITTKERNSAVFFIRFGRDPQCVSIARELC